MLSDEFRDITFSYDPTLLTMLIGRILIAIGSAVAFIGTLKVAADILPERVFPIAVGLTNTIGVLGGIFGQLFLNYLVMLHGWQLALELIGYFGILWSIVIIALLRSPSIGVINSNNYKFKYLSFTQSLKLLLNKNFGFSTLCWFNGWYSS